MNGAQSAARGNSPRDEVERVTLVDADDQTLGSCGKIEAHREGRLHRAFSILITSPDGKLLLQRRASGKYHFANRWSNACCGHPRPGEITYDEARRRLMEELGFTVPLIQVAELSYRAEDAVSGLVEHEYLHVFHGTYSGDPEPDPDEVSAWQWMGKKRIRANLASNPEQRSGRCWGPALRWRRTNGVSMHPSTRGCRLSRPRRKMEPRARSPGTTF